MDDKLLIAILTTVGTLIGIIINQRMQITKQKKELDEKQNDRINIVEFELKSIKDYIKILTDSLNSLKENFDSFVKYYNFKHSIKSKIEIKAETIIKANPIVNQNTNLVNLLLSGRNETINFANFVYFNQIEMSQSSLDREMQLIIDRLKMISNNHFTETKIIDNKEYTFICYLKNFTKLKTIINVLINNIIDFKSGVYNGKSDEKFIIIFEKFVENVFDCTIESFYKFKQL